MKTHKIYKIMLMALMLFAASLSITSVDAEAKAKAYKTKTVKVTSSKSKTVKTSKKIKKVAICSTNKNFTVKKTANKKFKVSKTDAGKTQTVKVTYTNKYTQKFKIKTKSAAKTTTTAMPSYAKKIVDELKPLLADPDKGLQTVLAQWEKKLGYECDFKLINTPVTGNTTLLTLDEITKNYTASQKKALVLEVYLRTRMTYGSSNDYKSRGTNAYYKKIYNGTFKGVCADGAEAGYDICQYLGLKAKYTGSMELNHGWCAIYVTDKNGVSYWHGIYTTSYGYNMKGTASLPNGWTMTKKQVESYKYNPYETFFKATRKQIVKTPTKTQTPATATPSVTTTPAPVPTQTPAATTEPTKAPVVSQEPTPTVQPTVTPTTAPTVAPTETPVVTPEPTATQAPVPTETPEPTPQRIMIPHAEHGYTCTGCNPLNPPPVRHTSTTNPYITNIKATYKTYEVYQHVIGTEVRWFDADGNEYIDINGDGDIMEELVTLVG